MLNFKRFCSILSKWILICFLIGLLTGTASALFLTSLDWVTNFRISNLTLFWFLPFAGFIIGFLYYYFGKEVVSGNNQILETYYNPKEIIPIKMAPLVLIGTLITHLFGGSAGREGTAIQMSGALSDQFSKIFKLYNEDRKILIIIAISAGFASVFGTPLAGAVFAIEIVYFEKINFKAILPSLLAAYFSDLVVKLWGVNHTQYSILAYPDINFKTLFWLVFVGFVFGITAFVFSKTTHLFIKLFNYIKYPPLRPFIGGTLLVISFYLIGTTKYMGLGIPTILQSFLTPSQSYIFIFKIALTALTLGSGFKGGEVTPLFFIGATLGSALSLYIPLPIALLAGVGFVAVFSGATHTPIACSIMGMELFGIESGLFVSIVCFVAYFCSGNNGIYKSQIVRGPKYHLYKKWNKKYLNIF